LETKNNLSEDEEDDEGRGKFAKLASTRSVSSLFLSSSITSVSSDTSNIIGAAGNRNRTGGLTKGL
jgi:hypothetical protein